MFIAQDFYELAIASVCCFLSLFLFWRTAKQAKMLICHSFSCEYKLFLQLSDNTCTYWCTCTCIWLQISTEHEIGQVVKISWRIIINKMAFSPSMLYFHYSCNSSLELFSRDSSVYLSMYQNNCTSKSRVKYLLCMLCLS